MEKNSKIFIPGHTGLLGSAVVRRLMKDGYKNILTQPHCSLDLIDQPSVNNYFEQHLPDYVIICAGKVGGIMANDTQRGDFIYKNMMMQFNILHAAYQNGCKKVMAVGSSCIYPAHAEQPIREDALLTGALEPTNEPYAISKIAALKMAEAYRKQFDCNFISAMPTNLYGPGDHYGTENNHVLPALTHRIHKAKVAGFPSITIWGSGTPRREFLYVDDCAEALVFLMKHYNESGHVNVGTGQDISIIDLACLIAEIIGYDGTILTDTTKPDGMMLKRLDVTKINKLGWSSSTGLGKGIKLTYDDYLKRR